MADVEVDWGNLAQQAGEDIQAACWNHLNDDAPEPEGLAGPFDGCQTCEVREILNAAYPYLRVAVMAELLAESRQRTDSEAALSVPELDHAERLYAEALAAIPENKADRPA